MTTYRDHIICLTHNDDGAFYFVFTPDQTKIGQTKTLEQAQKVVDDLLGPEAA